ncbi:MAG: phosphocholine cytidylyltransferase family protein [Candidatus Latescibacterota bacterium]
MKALVLAAGRGRRLWPYTAQRPKCLLLLNGDTILQRQLAQLERAGVGEAVVVCGHGLVHVQEALSAYTGLLRLRTTPNPLYDEADNLLSLWAARTELQGDVLLLNGDGVFHPGILEKLAATRAECCLAVARKAEYDEEDMKVELRDGRLVRIGKNVPPSSADAESVGALRLSGSGGPHLHRATEELVAVGDASRRYFVDAVQRLADAGFPVTCCDTDGLPWADIDTPADLAAVRRNLHRFQGAGAPLGRAKGSG